LARAAAEGNLTKLEHALGGSRQDKNGRKIQDAVVAAASKGQVEAMEYLLKWGAPVASRDLRDQRAFILATATGSLEIVKLMLTHKADPNEKDKIGKTPMLAAIEGPYLDIVKELTLAGAEAPENSSVRGVGQAIYEARLELMSATMLNYSNIKVDPQALREAEEKVWPAMREHMRLLELKEEKAAGDQMLKLETQIRLEEADVQKAELKAESLSNDLSASRVQLMKEESTLRDLVLDLDGISNKHFTLQEEDERIRAEIEARRTELEEAQEARSESQSFMRSEKNDVEQFHSEIRSLEGDVSTENKRATRLAEELRDAEAELQGWLRDKEAAAELTAQAHRLLGN